jgi:ADP-heptose:LPS heptosyltransferase
MPFLQLIPLFRRASLVISGDTGPMHLACALSTPVVAIMGPTAPVRNGPWSDRDEVVVHRLPCSFCNGRVCPTQNECMDISVEEVFAATVRRLEKNR